MQMLESLVLSRFRREPSKIPTAWSEQTMGGEPYCGDQEVRRPIRGCHGIHISKEGLSIDD